MLYNVYFFSCLLNLFGNFLALPLVKYIFLLQALLVLLYILIGDYKDLVWVLMSFSLFEGQGRVIWGYGILFRLLFDLLVMIVIIKGIVKSRKVINREVIPNYLLLGIMLHLGWFILELFNPLGPNLFAAFATSKYYVFPFFLFFFFQMFPIELNEPENQKKIQSVFLLLILGSALVIFQNGLGEEHLNKISPFYISLFDKYRLFQGNDFRPWGTSFGPGGMGTFFYSMIGIFFIYRPSVLTGKNTAKLATRALFKWGGLASIFFASFIGQVRSATLKSLLIVGGMFFLKFIGSRLKAKRAITVTGVLLIALSLFPVLNVNVDNSELGLSGSMERWGELSEKGLSGGRAGLDKVMDNLDMREIGFLGYGLGMTQGFLPDFEERRREHFEMPRWYFWHLDNLFFFLILELGVGSIFYIFVLVALIISLFSRLITLLRWREITAFSEVAVSFVSVVTMIVFSWGAVAIPFNPESFFFWFWAALGFNIFVQVKEKRAKMGLKEEEISEPAPEFDKMEPTRG